MSDDERKKVGENLDDDEEEIIPEIEIGRLNADYNERAEIKKLSELFYPNMQKNFGWRAICVKEVGP